MASFDDSELSRDLGPFAVFTTATGTMIGAGIFILPGPAAAGAGASSALSFGLAGLIALVATMCAVELATAMPRAGGPYFFASRAMGAQVGTIVGLGAWLALILKGSFALVGLGWYVSYFSAVPILAVTAVGGLLLVMINWVGAEKSGGLQNLVVIGLVVILAYFAGQGLFAIEPDRLGPTEQFFAGGPMGVITTTGLVFISYLGIVKATAVAGEVKDPGTTLPKALFASVIFVTVLYVAIMLIVTGVMPLDDIADSTAPVAAAGELFLGSISLGGVVVTGAALIAVAGILATVSTANAAILSSSRFPFAMARDGLMPPKLRQSSERFGTPTRAIWLTGGVMIALAVLFDVEGLAKLGGTFGILVFALLNLTVVLLRSSQPEWYDPDYRAPFSPVLPLLGALAALLLIPFMGLLSQISALVFIIIGIAWYLYQQRVGEPVTPGHDIGDQFQRIGYRQALDEKERRLGEDVEKETNIIVEIVEGKPNRYLLQIVEMFAEQLDAALDFVVVSEVPPQVALEDYDRHIDQKWLEKFEKRLDELDSPVTFEHIVGRDQTDALAQHVNEATELVVVDWHAPIRKYHLRESHVDEILRSDIPVRLAVFKSRGIGDLDEIVVATEQGPYDRAEVELADAIAIASNTELTLVKVLPEDAPEEMVDTATQYLDELKELVNSPVNRELIQHRDVEKALIERGNEADLLVLGAPSHSGRIYEFFGQTTDIVAAETDTSLLVAKDPLETFPWYRRLWRRITGP